jgi:hypothetical protein
MMTRLRRWLASNLIRLAYRVRPASDTVSSAKGGLGGPGAADAAAPRKLTAASKGGLGGPGAADD